MILAAVLLLVILSNNDEVPPIAAAFLGLALLAGVLSGEDRRRS